MKILYKLLSNKQHVEFTVTQKMIDDVNEKQKRSLDSTISLNELPSYKEDIAKIAFHHAFPNKPLPIKQHFDSNRDNREKAELKSLEALNKNYSESGFIKIIWKDDKENSEFVYPLDIN